MFSAVAVVLFLASELVSPCSALIQQQHESSQWTVQWIAKEVTPAVLFPGTSYGIQAPPAAGADDDNNNNYFFVWDRANNTLSQVSADTGATMRVSDPLPKDWNERTAWMPAYDYSPSSLAIPTKLHNVVGRTRPYQEDKAAYLIDLNLDNTSTSPGAFPTTELAGEFGNWRCLDDTSPFYYTAIGGTTNSFASLDIKVPGPFGNCGSRNLHMSIKGYSLERESAKGSEDPVLWEWILDEDEKALAIAQAYLPEVGPAFVSISTAPGQIGKEGRLDLLHIVALRADAKTGQPGTPVFDCGSVNISNISTGTAYFAAWSIPEARSSLILLRQQNSGRLFAFDMNSCTIPWVMSMPGDSFEIVTPPAPPSSSSPLADVTNNNDQNTFLVGTRTNYTFKNEANAAQYYVFRLSDGELVFKTEEIPFTEAQATRVNSDKVSIAMATVVQHAGEGGEFSLIATLNQNLYRWPLPSGATSTELKNSQPFTTPLDKCLTVSPDLMPLLTTPSGKDSHSTSLAKLIVGGKTASKDGCLVAMLPPSSSPAPPSTHSPISPSPKRSTSMTTTECQTLDCTQCSPVEKTLGCIEGSQVSFLRKCSADGLTLTIETFADSTGCVNSGTPIDTKEYSARTCYPEGASGTSFTFDHCN